VDFQRKTIHVSNWPAKKVIFEYNKVVIHSLKVLVPIFGMTKELPDLVAILSGNLDESTCLILVDDGSLDPKLDAFLNSIDHPYIEKIKHDSNIGYLSTANNAFNLHTKSDILVINSDVLVDSEFIVKMRNHASSDNTIASVSVWASSGTILTVNPGSFNPRTQVNEINNLISINSRVCTIPVAVGHAVYYRRAALNILGGFDTKFGPGYGEEVDFSLRAVKIGFRNVLAEDCYVFHQGASSFSKLSDKTIKSKNDEQTIKDFPEFPSYLTLASSPLNRARIRFEKAVEGFTVGLDGSVFNYPASGTTTITLAIIQQLLLSHSGNLYIVIDRDIDSKNLEHLMALEGISIVYLEEAQRFNFDIYWRPYQIWEKWRLLESRKLSDIFVLGIQDLIAYDNYSYHESIGTWGNYRECLQLASEIADGLTFISNYSKMRTDDLIDLINKPSRVIPNGIVPNNLSSEFKEQKNSIWSKESGKISILLVGMNFKHKYFEYVISLCKQFEKLGIAAEVTRIGHGHLDSKIFENIAFTDMGEVDDQTKIRLYTDFDLVLYPSVVEGFGLIPFEAAQHGAITLSSRQGGLNEYLPTDFPTIGEWGGLEDCYIAMELLENKQDYLRMLLICGDKYSWRENVQKHLEFFMDLLCSRNEERRDTIYQPDSISRTSWKLNFRLNVLKNERVIRVGLYVLPLGSMRRKLTKRILTRFI
jgi:GT2 family glycosyltransferase